MREPENLRKLAKLNPDFVGFIFYTKSKRYVGEEVIPGLNDILPSTIKRVGVFVNSTLPDLFKAITQYKLDFVQLHGYESVEYCNELHHMQIKVIKAFGVDESFDFSMTDRYIPYCDYFLFDTKANNYGGTGRKYNWNILRNYSNKLPVFLSGGIGSDDVLEIKSIDWLNLYAIDINSRFEIEPGLKDIGLLKTFFNDIRSE